ncbi:MAG: aminopeptidase P family protein [Ruminococcaceae bacterium]|nr:aminopeptidase P family protein [Oscillospiraceae bacterium]
MTVWELQKEIHRAVKQHLRPGMTELALAQVISDVCPHWQGDLITGERTAEIEGGPTNRVIQPGDVVLLDLQVNAENQWSDLTRVYFAGEPDEEQKEAYRQVLSALKAGEELLRPGTKGVVLWERMRKAIGTPYAFDHHGGHRIGTEEIVVDPRFVPECEEELKAGMIVTLEPAVYYPGKFGIRLENNYRITETGYERLDDLSLDESDYIVKG